MDRMILLTRICIISGSIFFCTKLETYGPMMLLFIMLMIVDYISGLLASKKEGIEHPGDKNYGWNSKKGIIGIYKKVGYILTVFVGFCIDYIIRRLFIEIGGEFETNTFFGTLIIIWIMINELISILENIGRVGVEVPDFLKKILTELKDEIENDDSKQN